MGEAAKTLSEEKVKWCPECLAKMKEIEAGFKRLEKKYGKHRLYAVEGFQNMLHVIEEMYREGKLDFVQRQRAWVKWTRVFAKHIE